MPQTTPTGPRDLRSIQLESAGHVVYAALMIAIGLQGLIRGDFTAVWQPVPRGVPGRIALVYFCACLSFAAGLGLLWRRTAAMAARLLLATLVLWLLVWRVRALLLAPLIEGSWSVADTLAMAAGSWVLFAWFATESDRQYVEWATGDRGVRIARVLYGLAMIPFGYAHFANLQGTADLIPCWIPWHVGLASLTGGAFLAAGVAILSGRLARLAATLSALQMGLFGLLVWAPVVASGSAKPYQWLEFATTSALTAAGWVVADSYRGTPWLKLRRLTQ